jgi:thioredoxin-dependent adenylylsulfate APS reductase
MARDLTAPARPAVLTAAPPIPPDVEALDAPGVLELAIAVVGLDRLVVVSAFGPEDVVVLDLLVGLGHRPRVVTLDTGRLPQETHDLIDRVRDHFELAVEPVSPDAAEVTAMVASRGQNLFYASVENRLECCDVRKVRPLARALAGAGGWVTGVRRDQTPNRAATPKVALDLDHGLIWKVAPLADWTAARVWAHARERGLPVNALHDRGYPSIGCAPCTRAVEPGEDPRAGRWWWEASSARECGLHIPRERPLAPEAGR